MMNRRSLLKSILAAAVIGATGWCPEFGRADRRLVDLLPSREAYRRMVVMHQEFSDRLVAAMDRVFEADLA